MSTAKTGDTVRVHYRGTLANGHEFDSSHERDPISFTIGDGNLIAQFEEAIVGMTVGEEKSFTIEADDAYGAHRPDLVKRIEREQIPSEVELGLGGQLQARQQDGSELVVTVVDLDPEYVTLDANHPLAGKDITFAVTLVGIEA